MAVVIGNRTQGDIKASIRSSALLNPDVTIFDAMGHEYDASYLNSDEHVPGYEDHVLAIWLDELGMPASWCAPWDEIEVIEHGPNEFELFHTWGALAPILLEFSGLVA